MSETVNTIVGKNLACNEENVIMAAQKWCYVVALTFFCSLKTFRLTFLHMRNKYKIINVQRNNKAFSVQMPRAVRQLSCDDYCEEFLKMSFKAIKYNFFV